MSLKTRLVKLEEQTQPLVDRKPIVIVEGEDDQDPDRIGGAVAILPPITETEITVIEVIRPRGES